MSQTLLYFFHFTENFTEIVFDVAIMTKLIDSQGNLEQKSKIIQIILKKQRKKDKNRPKQTKTDQNRPKQTKKHKKTRDRDRDRDRDRVRDTVRDT